MSPPDETAWEAWTPWLLADKLRGVNAVWYVVGGWAIDLWLGAQTRQHEDLEFATSPQDAERIASHLSMLTFYEARDGGVTDWDVKKPVRKDAWQFWGADLKAERWRVDMMIERGNREFWRYKRHPLLKQSRDQAIRTNADGIRYLAPSIVLLFKAKHCRAKDDKDFKTVAPKLSVKDRANLCRWLAELHPDHKWLKLLA